MLLSSCLILSGVRGTLAGSLPVLAPVTSADGRLGLCDVLPGTAPNGDLSWAQLASNAGARMNRWEFRWDRIERTRGDWNFGADDPAVQSDTAHGLATLGILIGTPGWAAARGQKPGNGVPAGLYLEPSSPRNLWATYVRTVVQHYAGQVRAWEIWNEPDLSFFWSGSPEDYFQMLKVAYGVIKATDPSARVILAGMVDPSMRFFASVLAASRADPGWSNDAGYFDVASWHAYGPARLVYSNLLHMRVLLRQYGSGGQPIWVTEAGFPASNPDGEPRQTAYVLQTVAYALAAGASKVFVYRASDDSGQKTWGLLMANGSPREAYIGFSVAAAQLSGAVSPMYSPLSHAERIAFYSPTSRITVLWNRDISDRTVDISAAGSSASLVDWSGRATTIDAVGGIYHVPLLGAQYNLGVDPTGSIVGGPPVFLIEGDSTPVSLPFVTFVPPMRAPSRRMLVVNGGQTSVSAVVRESAHRNRRVLLTLKPNSAKIVDMSLLGNDLAQISSDGALSAWGLGDSATTSASAPSTDWWFPSLDGPLELHNPSATPMNVTFSAFGPMGHSRSTTSVRLGSNRSRTWTSPAGPGDVPLSVDVRSSGAILAWEGGGSSTSAAHPTTTWYALKPGSGQLNILNPNGSSRAHVQVTYIGGGPVKSEQLEVGPYRTVRVGGRNARAATVTADSDIVTSAGPSTQAATIIPIGSTRSILSLSGSATQVAIFNPALQPTAIRLIVLNREQSHSISTTVRAKGLALIRVRRPGDGPRAIVLNSDGAVAAAPVS